MDKVEKVKGSMIKPYLHSMWQLEPHTGVPPQNGGSKNYSFP
jgi:hypothetical protein